MIYTLTFNPAVDYVMHTNRVTFGATNRSSSEEVYFGGKGINVSLVLSELGISSTALGFVGGFTGCALEAYLRERGILTDFVPLTEGFTRINVKIKGEAETEINGAGPKITTDDLARMMEKLDSLVTGDTLVLAGSVPSTVPKNIYETILSRFDGRGIRIVVDAEGDLLTGTLKYNPYLIKPNLPELEAIAGGPLECNSDIIGEAQKLKKAGAENVLVSLGEKGAMLIDADGKEHECTSHKGSAVNTVGAGDSMVAGFLAGLEDGYEYALRLGCAAGSATAFSKGLAIREDIQRLMDITS